MASARTLLTNLTPRGRLVLGAGVAGTLLVVVLLFTLASRPSYTSLMSGIDPAKTGRITQTLDERGIAYQLRNNGTAVAVQKAQLSDARIALATAGLSGSGGGAHPGFELVTKQKLGASNFQQQVAYQQALQGELATTIEQIDGVDSAQVHLVIPEEQLFSDQETRATANVLLSGDPSALDSGAVRGIAQLVASSVRGLKIGDVSITNEQGELLWPSGDGGTAGPSSGTKLAAEARYDQTLESQLNALLLRTVGPDKAQAQVHATLNVDQSTRDQLTYGKRGTPQKLQTDDETLRGTGASGGGVAGTGANIPAYAQTGGNAGRSNYRHRQRSTDFAVDKTVTKTKIAPGTVKHLGVALLVDSSVPAATVTALRRAVASAAGINARRGDTLAVSQVPFHKPDTSSPGLSSSRALDIGKAVAIALIALLFLAFLVRHLRRREDDALIGEPTWLREIEAPRPLSELESQFGDDQPTLDLRRNPNSVRRQLEDIVEDEPERVAAQVRSWMQDG